MLPRLDHRELESQWHNKDTSPDDIAQVALSSVFSAEVSAQDGDSAYETVSVSSVFLPGLELGPLKPDLILVSSDMVRFYVHSPLLILRKSFITLLQNTKPCQDSPPESPLDDTSNIVNIMLHAIYSLSCTHFNHSFDEISWAIDRLRAYGAPTKEILVPSNPLYGMLLYQCPLYPLPTYALASNHDIESLAIACSSHLLALPLHSIADAVAERIGALYLKRLFLLHHRRVQELRTLLSDPFRPHPVTDTCDYNRQQALTRAWTLTAAYLSWEARPDISTQMLESTFLSLEPNIDCKVCRVTLRERVQKVVTEWSLSKNTI